MYEGRKIPESMIIRIYTILISSLFNLGEYEELTNLEEEYSIYSKEKSNFKAALSPKYQLSLSFCEYNFVIQMRIKKIKFFLIIDYI